MITTEQVRTSLHEAISAIEHALTQEEAPESGSTSRSQLQQFQESLRAMLQIVDCTDYMRGGTNVRGIGHVIVDSWPLHSPLGRTILKAEQEYFDLARTVRNSN